MFFYAFGNGVCVIIYISKCLTYKQSGAKMEIGYGDDGNIIIFMHQMD
jgi:hypothetical protein